MREEEAGGVDVDLTKSVTPFPLPILSVPPISVADEEQLILEDENVDSVVGPLFDRPLYDQYPSDPVSAVPAPIAVPFDFKTFVKGEAQPGTGVFPLPTESAEPVPASSGSVAPLQYANEATLELRRKVEARREAVFGPPIPPPVDGNPENPSIPPSAPSRGQWKSWDDGVAAALKQYQDRNHHSAHAQAFHFISTFRSIYSIDLDLANWLQEPPVTFYGMVNETKFSHEQTARLMLSLLLAVDAEPSNPSESRNIFLFFARSFGLVLPENAPPPTWKAKVWLPSGGRQNLSPSFKVYSASFESWVRVCRKYDPLHRSRRPYFQAQIQALYPFMDFGSSIVENQIKTALLAPIRVVKNCYSIVRNGFTTSIKMARLSSKVAKIVARPKAATDNALRVVSAAATQTCNSVTDAYNNLGWIDYCAMGLPWLVMFMFVFKDRLGVTGTMGPVWRFIPSLAFFGFMFTIYRWYENQKSVHFSSNAMYNKLLGKLSSGFAFVPDATTSTSPPLYAQNSLLGMDEEISWESTKTGEKGHIFQRTTSGAYDAKFIRRTIWWDWEITHTVYVWNNAMAGLGFNALVDPVDDLTISMHPVLYFIMLTCRLGWARFKVTGILIAAFWAVSIVPLYFMWKFPKETQRFCLTLFEVFTTPSKWPKLLQGTIRRNRLQFEKAGLYMKKVLGRKFYRFEGKEHKMAWFESWTKTLLADAQKGPVPIAQLLLTIAHNYDRVDDTTYGQVNSLRKIFADLGSDLTFIQVELDEKGEPMLSLRDDKWEALDCGPIESDDSDSDDDGFEARKARHKSLKKGKGKNYYKKRAKSFKWLPPNKIRGKAPRNVHEMYMLIDNQKVEDNPNDPFFDFVDLLKSNGIHSDVAEQCAVRWDDKEKSWHIYDRWGNDIADRVDDETGEGYDERTDDYGKEYDQDDEDSKIERIRRRPPRHRRSPSDEFESRGLSQTKGVARALTKTLERFESRNDHSLSSSLSSRFTAAEQGVCELVPGQDPVNVFYLRQAQRVAGDNVVTVETPVPMSVFGDNTNHLIGPMDSDFVREPLPPPGEISTPGYVIHKPVDEQLPPPFKPESRMFKVLEAEMGMPHVSGKTPEQREKKEKKKKEVKFEAATPNPSVAKQTTEAIRSRLWEVVDIVENVTSDAGFAPRYVSGFLLPRHMVMDGKNTVRKSRYIRSADHKVMFHLPDLKWTTTPVIGNMSEPLCYGIPPLSNIGPSIKFANIPNKLERMVLITQNKVSTGAYRDHGKYCSYDASTDIGDCGGVVLAWNNNAWTPVAIHNKTNEEPINGELVNSGLHVSCHEDLFRKPSGPLSVPISGPEKTGKEVPRRSDSGAQKPTQAGTSRPTGPDNPGAPASK